MILNSDRLAAEGVGGWGVIQAPATIAIKGLPLCAVQTLSKTHNESADGRTHGRTHLDLLLQEVDFMLLLQKLLLLPSNLGSRTQRYTLHAIGVCVCVRACPAPAGAGTHVQAAEAPLA